MDYLASVAAYPRPDEKLRTEKLEVGSGWSWAGRVLFKRGGWFEVLVRTVEGGGGKGAPKEGRPADRRRHEAPKHKAAVVLIAANATASPIMLAHSLPRRVCCALLTQTQGGGNCANALTAAARLGLYPTLVTKVGCQECARGSDGEKASTPCVGEGMVQGSGGTGWLYLSGGRTRNEGRRLLLCYGTQRRARSGLCICDGVVVACTWR